MNYCYGCMEQMEPGQVVCPRCGYDNSYRHNEVGFLPEESILAGKYLVGRKLGKGGFGITYLGIDLSLNVKVAIKEYFPGNISTRSGNSKLVRVSSDQATTEGFLKGRDAFQKEAQTLALFNSPSIAHVREYFLENNTAYIVMDYVGGIGLDEAIKQNGGRLPWQRVVTLTKELMPELDRLHKKNLVHRDIKPANLKIVTDEDTGKERLVLLDFGAARSFASADATGTYTSILTHGYAPLEQYKTKSHQGPYTDVYALCATMYKAITGEIPPSALDMVDGEVKLAPFADYGVSVPAEVEKAILHGMALKSENRPQTMKELYEEFSQINITEDAQESQELADDKKTDEPQVPETDEKQNKKADEKDTGPSPKNHDDEKEQSYQEARHLLNEGTTTSCEQAVYLFRSISGYKDADALLKDCDRKIFELKSDLHYEEAKRLMSSRTTNSYKAALDELSKISIPGWKDSDELVRECEKKIQESSGPSPKPGPAAKDDTPEWKKVQQVSSQYQQDQQKNDENRPKKKKSVHPVLIVFIILILAAAAFLLIKPDFSSNKQTRSTGSSYTQKTNTPVLTKIKMSTPTANTAKMSTPVSSDAKYTGKIKYNETPIFTEHLVNKSTLKGFIAAGETVEITGDVVSAGGRNWVHILVPNHLQQKLGKDGWMYYSDIETDIPIPTKVSTPKTGLTNTPTVSKSNTAKIIKDDMFRKNPSDSADVNCTIRTGTSVTLTGQSRTVDYKEWIQIRYSCRNDEIDGWVPKDSLDISK